MSGAQRKADAPRSGDRDFSGSGVAAVRLAVVIVHYRTFELTMRCLEALAGELGAGRAPAGTRVIVVDNASGDGSGENLREAAGRRGWNGWLEVLEAVVNGGFSAGNNLGLRHLEADYYLLINSDAWVRPGALEALLQGMEGRPDAGLLGPRLLYEDGGLHHSCYRFMTPISEFLRAAATGPLSRLLRRFVTTLPHPDTPSEPDWISFACVVVRGAACREVGLMDEGYFLYFDDQDYCRQMRRGGWSVVHWPAARVVHSAGRSGPVREQTANRQRRPRYYYEARARYFGKYYGRAGLWLANSLFAAGRVVSLLRERLGRKRAHLCRNECRDNWILALHPLRDGAGAESR